MCGEWVEKTVQRVKGCVRVCVCVRGRAWRLGTMPPKSITSTQELGAPQHRTIVAIFGIRDTKPKLNGGRRWCLSAVWGELGVGRGGVGHARKRHVWGDAEVGAPQHGVERNCELLVRRRKPSFLEHDLKHQTSPPRPHQTPKKCLSAKIAQWANVKGLGCSIREVKERG